MFQHPAFRLCMLFLLDKEDNPDRVVYLRILGDGEKKPKHWPIT